MTDILDRHAGLATAWMQEVEQRMEQLPNPASMDSGFCRNDEPFFLCVSLCCRAGCA